MNLHELLDKYKWWMLSIADEENFSSLTRSFFKDLGLGSRASRIGNVAYCDGTNAVLSVVLETMRDRRVKLSNDDRGELEASVINFDRGNVLYSNILREKIEQATQGTKISIGNIVRPVRMAEIGTPDNAADIAVVVFLTGDEVNINRLKNRARVRGGWVKGAWKRIARANLLGKFLRCLAREHECAIEMWEKFTESDKTQLARWLARVSEFDDSPLDDFNLDSFILKRISYSARLTALAQIYRKTGHAEISKTLAETGLNVLLTPGMTLWSITAED